MRKYSIYFLLVLQFIAGVIMIKNQNKWTLLFFFLVPIFMLIDGAIKEKKKHVNILFSLLIIIIAIFYFCLITNVRLP